jgi:hypothetical protein
MDDFLSVYSIVPSVSDVLSNWVRFSPRTRQNPIPVENLENSKRASSIDASFDNDDGNEIPTPFMRSRLGNSCYGKPSA